MKEIKELFETIGKSEIDEFDNFLVTDGKIDSLDIINLVTEIENKYKIKLNFADIISTNFESFESIKELVCKNKL